MNEGKLPRRVTATTFPGRTNAVPIDEDLEDQPDPDVAPPAYGEHHDQLQFSQAGFAADAAVTANGRVNIHINEKNRRLSELLAPTLKRQLRADAQQLPSGPLPPAYIPPSLGGLPGQTPPPRLNVVIQIVGSRGDVQPFVALGQVLRDTYGHRVRVATHTNFKSFVEENGLEFFNIGGDPAQLMAFMVKNPGLMPGLDTLKSGDIKRRRQEIQEILMGCWRSCIEAGDGKGVAPPQHRRDEPVDERFVLPGSPGVRPFVADAIIANPPSFAHIHIAEKLGIPLHMMFTMPWTPTRAFPHPLADIVATNADAAITNYVSYALVEMMTWQGLGDVINRFRTNILELEPISLLWAPGLLNRLRIPATYCWSPALTPKPTDWNQEITVSGFYFLNLESAYTPDPDLAAFLAAGPPPVYIGFGSIVVDDPDALTQTIFSAVNKAGVRALVSKGWGGIGGDDSASIPEGIFMLGNCPHDWLFRHVAAVVHHGGAGTTAAGIKAGRPTVVVPFFGDQIFWGSMVAKAGAGPAPIPYKTLTAENLGAAIETALLPQTRERAGELGERIKEEKGADVGGKSFHQFLNLDGMRCSLAPSRVAVWRVRRSKIRLSTLAAAVLVKQGWLKYSDLKLYRSIEYNTDEQPWDPISAVLLAFVGDVGAFTMAVADFPREVFKGAKAKKDKETAESKDGKVGNAETEDTASEVAAGSSSNLSADSRSETPSILSPDPKKPLESAETFSLKSSTPSASTGLSSQPSNLPPPLPPRSPSSPEGSSTPTANPVNLDVAIAAGKGVGRIVGAGMKFHTNICLGLARGFRNAPRLYNDETIRPTEKVTGLASGVRVAGKEFGWGVYDGISGLVTQPWKGAEKEGGKGFIKGVGKGIGGLFLKNAAAVWSLPAYTFQGIQTEVRNMFTRSSANYIITSRVVQGEEDLAASTGEERRDVLARWQVKGDDLKGFYLLKQRESEKEKAVAAAAAAAAANANAGAPEEEQRLLGTEGPAADATQPSSARPARLNLPWARRRAGSANTSTTAPTPPSTASGSGPAWCTAPPPPATATSSSSAPSDFSLDDTEALERAIQQSVVQTSTGNKEEDAMVEAAIRASLMEMRRVAEQQQQQQQQQQQHQHEQGQTSAPSEWIADQKGALFLGNEGGRPLTDEEWTDVTDEEYQALVEEAVRQSLMVQQEEYAPQWADTPQHHHQSPAPPAAVELPGSLPPPLPRRNPPPAMSTTAGANNYPIQLIDNDNEGEEDDDDDDEQLRLAMEESEREHRSHASEIDRQRTEEEIVLEYVKRQSLAEAEFRRRATAALGETAEGQGTTGAGGTGGGEGKGKGVVLGGGENDGEEEEDEDLRRAIEESLRMGGREGGGGAGPSNSRGGGWE